MENKHKRSDSSFLINKGSSHQRRITGTKTSLKYNSQNTSLINMEADEDPNMYDINLEDEYLGVDPNETGIKDEVFQKALTYMKGKEQKRLAFKDKTESLLERLP